jgi:hypothetical protein
VSGSGVTWTINPDSVTFAKIQNINTQKLLGRYSTGGGNIEQITLSNGFSFGNDSLYVNYNNILNKPTLGSLAALNSADTSYTMAKVISVNGLKGIVSLTTNNIDTSNNKKYVSLQEKNTWSGKQDALGFTPVDKSDSTDVISYTTKKQFNDGQLLDVKLADSTDATSYTTKNQFNTGQLLDVKLADSSGVHGYTTGNDFTVGLATKVNKSDSTGVNGYATQDNLTKLKKTLQVKLILDATSAATTDSITICIPSEWTGYNLVDADAYVTTVSSSGTPTFTLTNVTDATTMLSTSITIDASEFNSYTAATPAVVNTSYDDVATGDRIKIKCTVAGTGTKGSGVILVFQKP